MAEEDGVLGNLPRSRPGRRSEKRGAGRPAGAAEAAAEKAEQEDAPTAETASGSGRTGRARAKAAPRRSGAQPRQERRQPEDPPREAPSSGGDPITGAMRAAGKVAGTGVQVAGAVAKEVLRRLPRP